MDIWSQPEKYNETLDRYPENLKYPGEIWTVGDPSCVNYFLV